MIFNSLEEKCNYYRNLTDYRLMPNGYVLVMIDGKNFSTLIKNKFEKPFDGWFIKTMNDTALHICKNIPNVVGAYVQSDEISFLIKDNTRTELPFDGRLCKLLSIIPAMASSFFTKKIVEREVLGRMSMFVGDKAQESAVNLLNKLPEYMFDCKVWNVPDGNEAISWFLYRQIDCVRNSKQQFCQTYMSHKELMNKNTDEQVKLCKQERGYDWNEITDDKKYGRFFYKDEVELINEKGEPYTRRKWFVDSSDLTIAENRETLIKRWIEK